MNIPKTILDKITWDTRNDEPEQFRVKSLVPTTKSCEHCDKTVTDQKIIHKIYDRPYTHWRTKCFTCKLVKHPETGEFTLPDSAAFQYFKAAAAKKAKKK